VGCTTATCASHCANNCTTTCATAAHHCSPYRSEVVRRQLRLGDQILDRLFPKLRIDTESETCPQCHRRLTSQEIRAGWECDPNVYTTRCPSGVNCSTPGAFTVVPGMVVVYSTCYCIISVLPVVAAACVESHTHQQSVLRAVRSSSVMV
jgi:hypothetical protein